MPIGMVAIMPFEEDWDLRPYLHYAFLGLQHRGGDNKVYCTLVDNRPLCMEYEGEGISQGISKPVVAFTSSDEPSRHWLEIERNGIRLVAIYDRFTNDLEFFLDKLLERSNNIVNEAGRIARDLTNSMDLDIPSFIALTSRGEILSMRSNLGISPLVIGGYGFDLAIVSSESSLIDILDSDTRRHVKPGEMIYIAKSLFKVFESNMDNGSLCVFEPLYLARHDSIMDYNIHVYEFRKELGRELARGFNNEIDIVVGVPETAYPYAIGLARELRKPFELGFHPTPGRYRSMLKRTGTERLIAIHLKMNPIRKVLEGKRIALVDDSMVTGTTIKTISQILRNKVGVEEIHLLIASPRLTRSCPYGYMYIDEKLLIASNLSEDAIVKYLEVDSLTWLNEDSLDHVARACDIRLCGRCFGRQFFG